MPSTQGCPINPLFCAASRRYTVSRSRKYAQHSCKLCPHCRRTEPPGIIGTPYGSRIFRKIRTKQNLPVGHTPDRQVSCSVRLSVLFSYLLCAFWRHRRPPPQHSQPAWQRQQKQPSFRPSPPNRLRNHPAYRLHRCYHRRKCLPQDR